MGIEGITSCAVQGCTLPISRYSSLCYNHSLPGMVVTIDEGSMVVTAWYVEHGDEQGIILLNDYALGSLFGGRAGFEGELARQGFVKFRNFATLEEVQAARQSMGAKIALWSGPWKNTYPWEVN